MGLQTLQAPGVPREVSEISVPVAHAMGLLHRLESTSGDSLAEVCPMVLSTLQRALHQLQWTSQAHPSLDHATDHVAAALSSVFTLSTFQSRPAAPPAQHQATVMVSAPTTHKGPFTFPLGAGAPAIEAPATAAPRTAPGPNPADALASTAEMGTGEPRAPSTQRVAKDSLGSASTDIAGLLRVDAALAANSATNFYLGFGGSDVVVHGGLFVATYSVPDLGQRIAVKVSMPGGHEFFAQGVVSWRRMATPGVSQPPDTPPGFGMKFVDLPASARELVARYAKNREPLLHDE